MNPGALITGAFQILGALLPLLMGVAGAEWWENRAAGQPAWAHVDILFVHLSPPASLAAQRDAARVQLVAAQSGAARLESAVAAQNIAEQARAAAGADALAHAGTAIKRYAADAAIGAGRLRRIAAPLSAASACARMSDADARFLGTLQ